MKAKLLAFLKNTRVLFGLYLLVALVASVHLILLGSKTFNGLDIYKHYNNFVIFRNAFFHLVHAQDLYIFYPQEQYDLFKYSPTFALLMFPFALLPAWAGVIVWNLANAALLFYAVSRFTFKDSRYTVFALWFILQETLTSLQSVQTNPMIAALLILAFTSLEENKTGRATLFIVCSAGIKIFGVLGFLLFFLYPNKGKFMGYSLAWTALLVLIPLLVVSPESLWMQYQSWWNMLQNDHSTSYGLSVMGWLKTWLGAEPDKFVVVLIGALLLLAPLFRIHEYRTYLFRCLYFSVILIWMIIFNHKAESSTFVIAVCGIAIWYYSQIPNRWLVAVMIFAFVFTCLSPTDLFPRVWRKEFVEPYVMKAVPCILIWIWVEVQLLTGRFRNRIE
ncbi:MAG: glycosyltransferase family 87 protein [Bacteroidia bacterium]|jgi:hypothetical protein